MLRTREETLYLVTFQLKRAPRPDESVQERKQNKTKKWKQYRKVLCGPQFSQIS